MIKRCGSAQPDASWSRLRCHRRGVLRGVDHPLCRPTPIQVELHRTP
jgi:hypothetical protein